jgi:hypothetical protein
MRQVTGAKINFRVTKYLFQVLGHNDVMFQFPCQEFVDRIGVHEISSIRISAVSFRELYK